MSFGFLLQRKVENSVLKEIVLMKNVQNGKLFKIKCCKQEDCGNARKNWPNGKLA